MPAVDAKTITLSGWASDESCGRVHTTPGNESCVAKCLRGGASVGHPEWLRQRLVLVSDDGKTIWFVENPDTLIKQAGLHVLVDAKNGQQANSVRPIRCCTACALCTCSSARLTATTLPILAIGVVLPVTPIATLLGHEAACLRPCVSDYRDPHLRYWSK